MPRKQAKIKTVSPLINLHSNLFQLILNYLAWNDQLALTAVSRRMFKDCRPLIQKQIEQAKLPREITLSLGQVVFTISGTQFQLTKTQWWIDLKVTEKAESLYRFLENLIIQSALLNPDLARIPVYASALRNWIERLITRCRPGDILSLRSFGACGGPFTVSFYLSGSRGSARLQKIGSLFLPPTAISTLIEKRLLTLEKLRDYSPVFSKLGLLGFYYFEKGSLKSDDLGSSEDPTRFFFGAAFHI